MNQCVRSNCMMTNTQSSSAYSSITDLNKQ
jgi:hypothetical protein